MCTETGIGSGTLYEEEEVFSTRELAQEECDRRNVLEEARRAMMNLKLW